MRFEIYQGEKITVSSSNLNLEGQLQKGIKYHVKLYRGDVPLIEWNLAAILLSKKVNVKYQNLPTEITEVSHRGFFKFVVWFGLTEMVVKLRPFRKAYFQIFSNSNKVADVYNPKKPTFGYRQFVLETDSDDEALNINIIVAFLLSLNPVG